MSVTLKDTQAWLAGKGWKPFPFQRRVWTAMRQGRSGLLHASTGTGKTLAVWLGALQALVRHETKPPPLTVLWITPMRALAADTELVRLNGPGRDSLRTRPVS